MEETSNVTADILCRYHSGLSIVKDKHLPEFHRASVAMYLAGISYVLGKVGVDHEAIPDLPMYVGPEAGAADRYLKDKATSL